MFFDYHDLQKKSTMKGNSGGYDFQEERLLICANGVIRLIGAAALCVRLKVSIMTT
jgi:hypothetical protein